jgi:hypothetical protein
MSTRNFEFRVSPRSGQRAGRFAAPASGDTIVIGAPVTVSDPATENELGLLEVELATGAQAPKPGLSGIAYYEHIQYQGDDPFLTTWSDKGTVDPGKAVQVVSGSTVKVALRNTNNVTFLNSRDYPGRTMVSEGVGATPNVNVGDHLTPGVGTDADGYWVVTDNADHAWLVVTSVDDARGEVEARMLF